MYLEVQGLKKRFGNKNIVDDLSFSLDKGKLMCILGSSGCGKTTTLNMIGGFLKADGGRILLDGQDITDISPEERPVTTVFQAYALFPHMSVMQNVVYGLKFKKVPKQEAEERGRRYLEMVGMAEYADRPIQSLSGGQQQRVALARALITEPKLCLLDEPFSNLDAGLREKLRFELKRLQKELGMTRTRYYNPHGLPGATRRTDNASSPADMVTLAEYFMEHPLLMEWVSARRAGFRKPGTRGYLQLMNHNNLLPGGKYASPGVDGIKTGFIARAGYCVTVTCLRNGKRMIAMVTGFPTARERDLFLRKLLNWGYARADDPAAALAETRVQAVKAAAPAPKKKVSRKTTVQKKTGNR